MKRLLILLIPIVILSCKKNEKSFNDVDCLSLSNLQDTAQVGLVKYWINTQFLGDGQIKVSLRSDNQVDINQVETNFIQVSNRFGCFQTGNSKKFFGINEDYYIYNEIPPTYTISGTAVKVKFTLKSKGQIELSGDSI